MPKLLTYSKIMKNLTVEKQSKYIKFDELQGDDLLRQKFEERLKLKQADRKYQKAMAAHGVNFDHRNLSLNGYNQSFFNYFFFEKKDHFLSILSYFSAIRTP
jgi:hypothetical protein